MSDNTDEIDLIELLKKIYLEKKLILKISILASLFGIVYALSLTNTYTASTTFIPQLSSGVKSPGSSISGLASLAGIDIGNVESASGFPPALYPEVVNGVKFKLNLLSSEIKLDDKVYIVKDYFLDKPSSIDIIGTIKKYTIGLPSLILSSFNSKDQKEFFNESDIYSITKEDKDLFELLDSSLVLTVNKKEGFITISCTDTNKNIAAQITQIAQNLLQEKIIKFKNKASKETLEFVLKQYDEIKSQHEILQDERAIFIDKNINISSSLFQNKLSRIESELNISESILLQLANQAEQARLQVNKDTPVFTIINPVTIPFERTAPKRSSIVIVFGFLGLVLSIGYVLFKDSAKQIINTIRS